MYLLCFASSGGGGSNPDHGQERQRSVLQEIRVQRSGGGEHGGGVHHHHRHGGGQGRRWEGREGKEGMEGRGGARRGDPLSSLSRQRTGTKVGREGGMEGREGRREDSLSSRSPQRLGMKVGERGWEGRGVGGRVEGFINITIVAEAGMMVVGEERREGRASARTSAKTGMSYQMSFVDLNNWNGVHCSLDGNLQTLCITYIVTSSCFKPARVWTNINLPTANDRSHWLQITCSRTRSQMGTSGTRLRSSPTWGSSKCGVTSTTRRAFA